MSNLKKKLIQLTTVFIILCLQLSLLPKVLGDETKSEITKEISEQIEQDKDEKEKQEEIDNTLIKNEEVVIEEDKKELPSEEQTLIEDSPVFEERSVNISTWKDLVKSLKSPYVEEIHLSADLYKSVGDEQLPQIDRSIKLYANNNIIDFNSNSNDAFILANTTSSSVFELHNLRVKNLSSSYLIRHAEDSVDANVNSSMSNSWTIILDGLSHVEPIVSSNIVKATQSEVQLSGVVDWTTNSNIHSELETSTSGVLVATNFIILPLSTININASNIAFNSNPTDPTRVINFHVLDGANVNVSSQNSVAVWIGKQGNANPIDMKVQGSTTRMKIRSNSILDHTLGALTLSATHQIQDDLGSFDEELLQGGTTSSLQVINGAQIDIEAQGNGEISSSALVSQMENGKIIVDGNQSKLKLVSKGIGDIASTLRFSHVGGQALIANNHATVEVVKEGSSSTASAVRFVGKDNKIEVQASAKINISNQGGAGVTDPGNDGRNQGIEFAATKNASQTILASGIDSELSVKSKFGSSIDSLGGSVQLELNNLAQMLLYGKTMSENQAIINVPTLQLSIDNPRYFDFMNERAGGGQIFNAVNPSKFHSVKSDIALWNKEAALDKNASKSWSIFDVTLSGNNFKNIDSTNIPYEFTDDLDSYGRIGMSGYTRIVGNNNVADVDMIYPSSNADQFLYGHVVVKEANGFRDAWNNEVYVHIKISEPSGYTVEDVIKTKGIEAGIAPYDGEVRGGMFKYDYGRLIPRNSKIEILEVWRGVDEVNSSRSHVLRTDDISHSSEIVLDVLPPLPAMISPIYDTTKVIQGEWKKDLRHNDDAPVDMRIEVNGEPILGTSNFTDGNKWSFTIEGDYKLNVNDEVQVFLIDEDGNINPYQQVNYHDTSYQPASRTSVLKTKYSINAKDFSIYDKEVSNLSDESIIERAEAEARNDIYGNQVPVKVLSSTISSKPGIYDVSFAAVDDVSVTTTIRVEVLKTDYTIHAYSTSMLDKDVASLNDEKLIKMTLATGRNETLGIDVDVKVLSSSIQEEPGRYPVTFALIEDESVTTTVYVTVEKQKMNYTIHAYSTSMLDKDVASLNDDKLIKMTLATGRNETLGVDVDVKVLSSAIKEEPGRYPVTFALVEDESVTTTVYVTVEKQKMNYTIDGNNISMSLEQAKHVSDELLLSLSGVKGFNSTLNEEVPVKVLSHSIVGSVGEYEVVFAIIGHEEINLRLRVVVNEEVNHYSIDARDFTIFDYEVTTLNNEKYISNANAVATNITKGIGVNVVVEKSNVQPIPGEYTVVFSVEDSRDITKSIQVSVINSYIPVDPVDPIRPDPIIPDEWKGQSETVRKRPGYRMLGYVNGTNSSEENSVKTGAIKNDNEIYFIYLLLGSALVICKYWRKWYKNGQKNIR